MAWVHRKAEFHRGKAQTPAACRARRAMVVSAQPCPPSDAVPQGSRSSGSRRGNHASVDAVAVELNEGVDGGAEFSPREQKQEQTEELSVGG